MQLQGPMFQEPALLICHGLGFNAGAHSLTTLIGPWLQNDTKKLAEAKQAVYLKGFTDGVMLVGPYAGRKVGLGRGQWAGLPGLVGTPLYHSCCGGRWACTIGKQCPWV